MHRGLTFSDTDSVLILGSVIASQKNMALAHFGAGHVHMTSDMAGPRNTTPEPVEELGFNTRGSMAERVPHGWKLWGAGSG